MLIEGGADTDVELHRRRRRRSAARAGGAGDLGLGQAGALAGADRHAGEALRPATHIHVLADGDVLFDCDLGNKHRGPTMERTPRQVRRSKSTAPTARRFHWWTVLLIAIQVPLGLYMAYRGNVQGIFDASRTTSTAATS